MQNLLIYDCEIIKLIPSRHEANDPRYQYCQGWEDHKNMGVSVLGAGIVEGGQLELRSFIMDRLVSSLVDLEELDIEHYANDCTVIGFNSKNFDDKLMAANGVDIKTDYDLLEEVRLAAYGSTDYRDCPKGRTYALGAIAAANGFAKTGTGELAPKLWQESKHDAVVAYCLNDVRVTYELLLLGLAGELIDPNPGTKRLQLRPLPEQEIPKQFKTPAHEP